MTIREIMTVGPAFCEPEMPLADAARLMCENDCGEIPIVASAANAIPLGVVTDRDIVCRTIALGKNPLDLKVKDCMSAPCVTVTPEASIDECCVLLAENKIRRIPVVDEDGRLCGIVSQADLALRASREMVAEVIEQVSMSAQG